MLSMKAKYALRALCVLARKDKAMMQIKTIAKEADVPHKFLETIMQELRSNGFVDSKRGVFGGYHLSQNPEHIYVGNIIRAIDGPLAPTRCASVTAYKKCDDCHDEKTCAIRKLMVNVRNAISNVLDNYNLRELAGMDPKGVDFINYCI